CLDAIREGSTYPSYEIVVVDNDSTDGTTDELIRLASAEPKIRMACLDRDHGVVAAARIAAGIAIGDYRAFLAPDTLWSPGWIERLMRRVGSEPRIGAVTPVSSASSPLRCCLLSRQVWDKAGDFDQDFFLRVERAGYRVVTAVDCEVQLSSAREAATP